ncbi:aminoglycoside phosphotransferase family protein [Actinosynnema sp. NPDC023587]|uniref:aminoglycoside phosphotransferase family protein n=1 Tax=Actinosynnema sp. NPDC023587 TaxID=3154695 RepID=UPI003411CE6E
MSLHSGQFHDVVITPDRVLRYPRTAAAAAELPGRAALLVALNTLALGTAVPRPLAELRPAPLGEFHLVLSRVPGAPLDQAGARAAIDVVAGEFARVLRAMSEVDGLDGVPTAAPGRWVEFADGVRAELFPLMDGRGRERAARELAAVLALDHVTTGLVHGDLGGENVLWVDGPELAGIVDWDGAAIGDPAEDVAAIGASYGPELVARVTALLGWRSSAHRIAAYQGTFALQQALSGALDGDDEELADGLAGYRPA